jgi:hypothetical protein
MAGLGGVTVWPVAALGQVASLPAIVVGCLILAGCGSLGAADPPAVSSNPGHEECKAGYDKSFAAAQGDADALVARRRYWACLAEKGDVYTARRPPPP